MIRILYDNQIFKIQKFGGVSRYFSELFTGLKGENDFTCYPPSFYSKNKHLRLNRLTFLDKFSDTKRFRGKLRIERYLENKEFNKLEKRARSGAFDIFHPTYYNSALVPLIPGDKRFVLTVYDMIHELYYDPHFGRTHDETTLKQHLIPRADHIVAISQSTKNDILRFFPEVDEKKISVIYLGSSFETERVIDKVPAAGDHILFVGNRGLYKNFEWMLQAIAPLLKTTTIKLVCAGGGGMFTTGEQELISNQGVGNKVSYLPVHSDNDLIAAYKSAACFIFPSLYEGFGIPILEAFSCGCPAILPDASCFPEIAGDAALYFEKMNAESLVKQVLRICSEPALGMQLRAAAYKRLEMFSWHKTIEQHIQLYRSLVN